VKDYPVGKAQQMVLDALRLTATGHGDASRKFEQMGLVVASKRQGRTSVPSITRRPATEGGMHAGDGWSQAVDFGDVDFDKISQWLAE
jgi:hypothetical protein